MFESVCLPKEWLCPNNSLTPSPKCIASGLFSLVARCWENAISAVHRNEPVLTPSSTWEITGNLQWQPTPVFLLSQSHGAWPAPVLGVAKSWTQVSGSPRHVVQIGQNGFGTWAHLKGRSMVFPLTPGRGQVRRDVFVLLLPPSGK